MAGAISNGSLIVNQIGGYNGAILFAGQNSLTGLTVNAGLVTTTNGTVVGRLFDPVSGGSLNVTGGQVILAGREALTTLTNTGSGIVTALGALSASSITNSGTLMFSHGATVSGAFNNQPNGQVLQRHQRRCLGNDGRHLDGRVPKRRPTGRDRNAVGNPDRRNKGDAHA